MPKWVWVLLCGGIVTYVIYKTHKSYAWIAGVLTLLLAYLVAKKG